MPLQSSGQISLNDLHLEAGGASGTECSMNDSDIRALIGKSSGVQMSFSEWYGASAAVNIALTISSNTNNYNIFSNRGGTYSAGKSNITLTVNSGVTVGSTSTGTYALDTGTGWASGDTITIVNNGLVIGKGGNGGTGGSGSVTSSAVFSSSAGTNGSNGGHAFRSQFATTITNNGTFAGGGGGGGGGGVMFLNDTKTANRSVQAGGGGGGGAGVTSSSGGGGGTASGWTAANNPAFSSTSNTASSGSSGSSASGGAGGIGVESDPSATTCVGTSGGAGGGRGSNGATGNAYDSAGTTTAVARTQAQAGRAGGTRGNYAVGNSNITWSTTGTRQGGVSQEMRNEI